jgi:hypothetical protein
LLPLYLHIPDPVASKEIRVGTKVATWDTRFKLILVSSSIDSANLPSNLLARVTLVGVNSSSLVATMSVFENTFLEQFDGDVSPRHGQLLKTQLCHRVKLRKYESDALDIFADIVTTQQSNPTYDHLTDEETVKDLLKSKECYFAALNTSTDFSSAKEEPRSTLQPFRALIKLCHVFWQILSRVLPRLSRQNPFSLSSYTKLIVTVFANESLRGGTLTADQQANLRTSLINATFQFVF